MPPQEIVLRKSPFVFLKRAALLILFFALLPSIAALLLNFREQYAESPLVRVVPDYALFVVLLLAALQFGLTALAFMTWYIPLTIVNRRTVIHRPGPLSPDKKLLETPSITDVAVRQGPLGRRLDYGTLAVSTTASAAPILLKDIPNPSQVAETILQMVDPALAALPPPAATPAAELVTQGENQHVEFKASLMWDYNRQAVNKDLYEPVMKNVVAFMNTAGGTVLVGVGDDGRPLGLEPDYAGLPKKNLDGWENTFNQAFNQMIGAEYRQYVQLQFEDVGDQTVCAVWVQPASAPAYLSFKGKEEFYIRTGNSTQPLSISKAARYMQTRFASANA